MDRRTDKDPDPKTPYAPRHVDEVEELDDEELDDEDLDDADLGDAEGEDEDLDTPRR
ncbi:MAG TPA: hypothetical protein VFX14_01200 [Methylomirabilota bacterium]|nr:hypothetical protein [Methylomirabilota bacterium]